MNIKFVLDGLRARKEQSDQHLKEFKDDSIQKRINVQCCVHMDNLETLIEIPHDKLTDEMYLDYYNASVFLKSFKKR